MNVARVERARGGEEVAGVQRDKMRRARLHHPPRHITPTLLYPRLALSVMVHVGCFEEGAWRRALGGGQFRFCAVHGCEGFSQHEGCLKSADSGGTPHCLAHGGGKRCKEQGGRQEEKSADTHGQRQSTDFAAFNGLNDD
ncbi:hypothetical protein TrVE_jg2408 [Triparma verrucosa]|uniref:Uncharacterized protein n=1 Tax=Triparma verrucosa TaxID=1606542 RepID=A0A9W7CK91_9STRA|nr:hypothetical protein TrVE_jg2408 [Triparma verrucosa]